MIKDPSELDNPENTENVKYIGTVVANNDPTYNRRIKVTIPGKLEGSIDTLPWVGKYGGGGLACGPIFGSFGVPALGSLVGVEFQNGDIHYPLYTGLPKTLKTSISEELVNYPNRYGFRDEVGNVTYIDKTSGSTTMFLKHFTGTTVQISNDGSVQITAVAPITSSAPMWTHTGPVKIDGDLDVTGHVIAGFGTGDQVGLQTHTHNQGEDGHGDSEQPTDAPNAGT